MPEPLDLRTLCRALGFMAIATHGRIKKGRAHEAKQRALVLAAQIEEFCLQCGRSPDGPADAIRHGESAEGPMAIITRLAYAIAEILKARGGACRPDDLLGQGFTREQIDRHWLTAQALAHVILNQPPPPADA